MFRVLGQKFPARLFWQKFLKPQLLLFFVFAIVTYFSVKKFENAILPELSEQVAADLQKFLFILFGAFLAIYFLVGSFVGISILAPLGRLIERAENLSKKGIPSEVRDEPAELGELSGAIERARQELLGLDEKLLTEDNQIETIMSAIAEAVAAVDMRGRLIFYNSQFGIQFFRTKNRSAQPHISEIIRSPEVLQLVNQVLESSSFQRKEIPILVTENEQKIFSVSGSPLKSSLQKTYGVLIVFYDLTELKRAEKIRIDFVGNVSHELRTPLTSIKGYAQTLKEDVENQRIDLLTKYAVVISKNVDKLMELVSDLLDISSLDSGVNLKIDICNPEEITQNVILRLANRTQEKNHSIVPIYDVKMVRGDPSRIEQVVSNLVENAIKYVPANGKIEVKWSEGKDGTTLSVKDNGPGIPTHHQSRLFERFYRIDEDRSREKGGTGLGLAIVKHIVQSHGGQVSVASEVGRGTEFTCSFPN